MGAPPKKPRRKVCVSLEEDFLDRLARYPGEQSAKIQILCEYAMEMGCLMDIDEAREKAGPKLYEAIKTQRKVPTLFEKYLQ